MFKTTVFIGDFILFVSVFICGAVVMAFEIVGSRVLGPFVGTSIFIWTSIIGVILIGLTLGYWLGGKFSDRFPRYELFAGIILGSALIMAFSTLIKGHLLDFLAGTFDSISVVAITASLLLFFIPALLLGMVSPFAARLKISSVKESGSTVGYLYAVSTIGSITGTFLAGFYFIPHFKVTNILYMLSLTLLLTSAVLWLFILFRSTQLKSS